jgi:hypothetical protein
MYPDGNDNAEFAHRMHQATKMKQCIVAALLGHEYIGIGFKAIWKMMIQYPLGATCFTIKQCAKIQARYLPTFLSKMGINCTMSTAICHGQSQLGGMIIFSLEMEQGVHQTKLVIAHL